jgi:hypothetical protein
MIRRVVDCISRPKSGRESCSAGEMPHRIAVTIATPTLKKRTGQFILITASAG